MLQAAWKKAKQATVAQSAAAEEKLKRAQEQVEVLQAELEKAKQAIPAGSAQADEKKPEGTLSTSELSELARMAKRFRKPNMPN
jgi:hypothetical protein